MRKISLIGLAIFLLANLKNAKAQQPNQVWSKLIAGFQNTSEHVNPRDVATDNNDNVFIAGNFTTAIRQPISLSMYYQGEVGYHIIKFSPSGTPLWAVKPGYQPIADNHIDDYINDIETDPSGNVYYAGARWASPNTNLIFGKLNGADGSFNWYNRLDGTGTSEVGSIDTDISGNLYITGHYSGSSVDFDPGTGTYNLGFGGSFVAVYNTIGNFIRAFGLPVTVTRIALDPSNNILITGFFTGTVDFDPEGGVTNKTSSVANLFVAKYSPTGSLIWVNHLQSVGSQTENEQPTLTADASGNVILAGSFIGSAIDFDPGGGVANLISSGSTDAFLAKYDQNGNYQFAFNVGGTDFDRGKSVKTNISGDIYFSGTFQNTIDFDPGSGVTTLMPGMFNGFPQESQFLCKYDPNGLFKWAQGGGGASGEDRVDIDAHSNVLWHTKAHNVNGTAMSFITKYCDPPVVSVSSSAATICKGDAVTLTAAGATTYTWTGPDLSSSTGSSVNASPTGIYSATAVYTVTGTNANGCTASKSITINIHPQMITVTPASATFCVGGSAVLTASGGTSSYTWSPATGLSSTSGATVTANPTTTTTYTVTGPDGNGCTSSKTVTVGVLQKTLAITPAAPSICLGSSVVLRGTGNCCTYVQWTPSTGLSATNTTTVTAAPTTTTTYSFIAQNSNGCQETKTVTVTVIAPVISIAPIDALICPGSSVNITASGASTYSWSPSSTLSSSTGASVTASPTNGTVYTVTGTDVNGCTSTKSTAVNIAQVPPAPTITGASVYCGSTVNLTASAPLATSYTWSTGYSTTGTTTTLPLSAGGNYSVIAKTVNGCISPSSAVKVVTDNRPSITMTAESTIAPCSNNIAASLTPSEGQSYIWYKNDQPYYSASSSTPFPVSSPGKYFVRITNPTGCSGFTINSNPIVIESDFAVSISGTSSTCPENPVELYVNIGAGYHANGRTQVLPQYDIIWSTGEYVNSIFVYPGTYSVTVTNNYTHCVAYATYTVATAYCPPPPPPPPPDPCGPNVRCQTPESATAAKENVEPLATYPNPANHELTIMLNKPAEVDSPITLFNVSGRRAISEMMKKGESQKVIYTNEIPAGAYYLQCHLQEGIQVRKVIIVHEK